jgi:pimeloyl-ACP methyl ester carboxylesterase
MRSPIHELWTGCDVEAASVAEATLLRRYVRTPFEIRRVPVDLSQLGLGTQYINTLELNPDAPGPAIVWAHGAGAGLGFGYRNYDNLAKLGGRRRRVLAFDWLGQANSSRPPFPSGRWQDNAWTLSEDEMLSAALRFFLESLEAPKLAHAALRSASPPPVCLVPSSNLCQAWRAAVRADTMYLIAHSTGGYVAAQSVARSNLRCAASLAASCGGCRYRYALKWPVRVMRLVLHGAAGLGTQPALRAPSEPPPLLPHLQVTRRYTLAPRCIDATQRH